MSTATPIQPTNAPGQHAAVSQAAPKAACRVVSGRELDRLLLADAIDKLPPPLESGVVKPAAAADAWKPELGRNGCDLRWLEALAKGLHGEPHLVEVRRGERVVSRLPLVHVRSLLFGRFLVSLPYANTAGLWAEDAEAAGLAVDAACRLADGMQVKFLELRHEEEVPHAALQSTAGKKVIFRLPLPTDEDALWKGLDAKVRNQVRKGQKQEFFVHFGREELLPDFYAVFAENMRDLGTPVYGRELFSSILRSFESESELCVIRAGAKPVAAALLVHERQATIVPSASSLRSWNSANPNMLMYWRLLCRAVERGQPVFDFGRSSPDAGTAAFKKQWGAVPSPSVWQHYLRQGKADAVRPDGGKFGLAIRMWKKLPLWLADRLGPSIVRCIP